MKFTASVILMLALMDLFHCAPLIGSDSGTYKETETSSSWGYNVGVDGKIGLEGGFKDGFGSLGIYKHFGANVGGHKRNGQKDINHPITLQATPQYAQQYIPQYPIPYSSQYGQQSNSRYALQWPQGVPQNIPHGYPQYIPQGSPQYIPQYAPQGALQYNPQVAPPYNPQVPPQYVPQGAPENVTQKATPYDTTAAPH